jgi:sec-independent protein translocase protein TatA
MIGMPEMVVIGGVIALLFGAKKLPEMGRSIGEGIREFKRSIDGIKANNEGMILP